jgi:hypothetical protein
VPDVNPEEFAYPMNLIEVTGESERHSPIVSVVIVPGAEVLASTVLYVVAFE